MEPQLLKLFGFDLETLAAISGIVFFLAEAAKKKFPTIFIGGWKTDILALAVSLAISFKIYFPNYESIAIAAILCWLIPVGLHSKTN